MKILYIGAFRFPNFDAAASRVFNNAKVLKALNHDISFLAWGGRYREQDLCEDGKFRFDGFEYSITKEIETDSSLVRRLLSYAKRGKTSENIIKRSTNKPDLIILYNASYWWTKTMIRFCNRNHIYLANDITEWYANNELYVFQWIPNWLNMIKAQKGIHNKIVISSYLNKFYSGTNNILVPPLCDHNDSKWAAEIKDERIKDFNGITLIYAGTPGKKDCLHTVVDVINMLAHEGHMVRFLVLGCKRDDYLEKYNSQLSIKGLHQNIIFLGKVPQTIVPAYYKKADFMVLLREPTRKSMAGFPTKVAESIMAGTPVITNATSDLKSYIFDNKTGFIIPGFASEDLYQAFITRILPLSRKAINSMKEQTIKSSVLFNYVTYESTFKRFINELKY